MRRRVPLTCVLVVCFGGTAPADDRRDARSGAAPTEFGPPIPVRAFSSAPERGIAQAGGKVVPAPGDSGAAVQPVSASPPVYPNVGRADGSCDPIERLRCGACGPDESGWVTADYLLWAVKSGGTPPLVARDPPGTPRAAVGVPTTPGRSVLFGGPGLNGDLRSGFRIGGGFWLDPDRHWALSGDFFLLGSGTDGGTFASPGDPPLSRPFFNVVTGLPDAELVGFPGSLSGSVSVSARNTFVGAGAFLRRNLCCDFDASDPCGARGYRVDLLAGYRYYGLNDDLRVREDLLSTGQPGAPPGTRIVVTDRFRTTNSFNGGLLGLAGGAQSGRWSADFRGGASLGNLHRGLTIDGSTVVTVPGQVPSTRTGGLLAQRSNIGRYTSDVFTVAPEFGANIGYQLTPGVRIRAGYTFLYLPNAWRAGDQIDRGIDPVQLRGGVGALGRPAPVLASTGAFVQGVNVGLTFRY